MNAQGIKSNLSLLFVVIPHSLSSTAHLSVAFAPNLISVPQYRQSGVDHFEGIYPNSLELIVKELNNHTNHCDI